MQLACPTLAAFTKYPVASTAERVDGRTSTKKFGFFQSEHELFAKVAETTGMLPRTAAACAWSRHPLAFLVEAADDITYLIVDFEDGQRLGLLHFDEVVSRLKGLCHQPNELSKRLEQIKDANRKVEYWRNPSA